MPLSNYKVAFIDSDFYKIDYGTQFSVKWDALSAQEQNRFINLASTRIKRISDRPFIDLGDLEFEQAEGVQVATSRLIDYWMEYGLDLNRISGSISLGSFSASQTVPSDPDYIPESVYEVLQDVQMYTPAGYIRPEDLYRADDQEAITYGVRFKTLERIKEVNLDKSDAEDANKALAIPTSQKVLDEIRQAKLSPFVIIGNLTEPTGTTVLPSEFELKTLFDAGNMVLDDGTILVPTLSVPAVTGERVPVTGEAVLIKLQNGNQETTNFDGSEWRIDGNKNSQNAAVLRNTNAIDDLNGSDDTKRAIKASEGDTRYLKTDGSNTMGIGYSSTSAKSVVVKEELDSAVALLTSASTGHGTSNAALEARVTATEQADATAKSDIADLKSTQSIHEASINDNRTNITRQATALQNKQDKLSAAELDVLSGAKYEASTAADVATAISTANAASVDAKDALSLVQQADSLSKSNKAELDLLTPRVDKVEVAADDYTASKTDFVRLEDITGGVSVNMNIPFTVVGTTTVADLSGVDMSKFTDNTPILGQASPKASTSGLFPQYGRDTYNDGASTDNTLVGQSVKVEISDTQLINTFADAATATGFARDFELTMLTQLTGAAGANVDSIARSSAAAADVKATQAQTGIVSAVQVATTAKSTADAANTAAGQAILSATKAQTTADGNATEISSINSAATALTGRVANNEADIDEITNDGKIYSDDGTRHLDLPTGIGVVATEKYVDDKIAAGGGSANVDLTDYRTSAQQDAKTQQDIASKQDQAIPAATTTDKTVLGAINELKQTADGNTALVQAANTAMSSKVDNQGGSSSENIIGGAYTTFYGNNGVYIDQAKGTHLSMIQGNKWYYKEGGSASDGDVAKAENEVLTKAALATDMVVTFDDGTTDTFKLGK